MALGLALLSFGIALLVLGTRSFFAMKRLSAAPFRTTGEIASDPGVADLRGMVSTEGKVVSLGSLHGPCSGRACLYYEVRIDRHWEKLVVASRGPETKTKTETGQSEVSTRKGGALFQIDDGSGPVSVDARKGIECDLAESHHQRIVLEGTGPGELVFGEMRLPTPAHTTDDTTTAFTAVERILPAEGSLYACGKLHEGAIGKPGWTALRLSPKGRGALLGGTRTRAALGLAFGGLLTFASMPAFFLFVPGLLQADTPHESPPTPTVEDAAPAPSAREEPPPAATSATPVPPPPFLPPPPVATPARPAPAPAGPRPQPGKRK